MFLWYNKAICKNFIIIYCFFNFVNFLIKVIYQFLISTQHIQKGFGLGELKDDEGNLTG